MRRWIANLPGRVFLLLMLAGFGLIASASLEYFDFDTLPAFMLEKLPLRFESLWLFSLRAHVASALLTFPLCIVLMTRFLQRRPALHRVLGRITGIAILLVLVPSGAVLALNAKGGALVSAGFLLSGAIVGGFMVRGVLAARRRDLVTHRHAMRHVFAQMSVAVSSRVLMILLDRFGMHPELAYVIALWGPVVASALVVELPTLHRVVVRLLAAPYRRPALSRFEPLKGTPS